MVGAGYGLRLTAYGRLSTTPDDEAPNLATPQARREAKVSFFHSVHGIHSIGRILGRCVGSQECKLLLGYLVLASTVFLAVRNFQNINDPAHPEIVHQWLPWFFGPGLTPEALVWSAWTQAIILPLLGALGMASCILRLGKSKSFTTEILSLTASLSIFLQLLWWEYVFLSGLKEHPTEERQRELIEMSWSGHLCLPLLTFHKLILLVWESAANSSFFMWVLWCMLRLSLIMLKLGWASWIGAAVAIGSWLFLILSSGLRAWALWAAANEASQFREIRKSCQGLM